MDTQGSRVTQSELLYFIRISVIRDDYGGRRTELKAVEGIGLNRLK